MMRGLIEEAGVFRSRPVGVVDSQGRVVHFGTLPQYVPGLIADLLDWTRNSDLHMLIRSCVFHYEFELIHPFADGNGRVGRLWHTLLLSRWNPAFAWLPVESVIHDRQQGYYDAINISNNVGESTAFIEFMLSAIQAALTEAISAGDGMSDEAPDKETARWRQIETYLKSHDCIRNADVRALCGVSACDGQPYPCRFGCQWTPGESPFRQILGLPAAMIEAATSFLPCPDKEKALPGSV